MVIHQIVFLYLHQSKVFLCKFYIKSFKFVKYLFLMQILVFLLRNIPKDELEIHVDLLRVHLSDKQTVEINTDQFYAIQPNKIDRTDSQSSAHSSAIFLKVDLKIDEHIQIRLM